MSDVRAFFGGSFDPQTVEPQPDFEVMPPGDYPVMVDKAEFKRTKAGTGQYLKLDLSILDGPGKGRKLWDRLNIDNPSEMARKIAMQTVSALCRATGISKFDDTDQLLGKTCLACVKVKDNQNEIRTYKPFGTPAPEAPVSPSPPVQCRNGMEPAPRPAPEPAPAQPVNGMNPVPAVPPERPPWQRSNEDIPF